MQVPRKIEVDVERNDDNDDSDNNDKTTDILRITISLWIFIDRALRIF